MQYGVLCKGGKKDWSDWSDQKIKATVTGFFSTRHINNLDKHQLQCL